MASCCYAWKPPPIQASERFRQGDGCWKTERYIAPAHRKEHPKTGRDLMEGRLNGYVVVVEHDEAGGYSTWSPDLPGCVAAASDYTECIELMREAIDFHLDGLRADGQPIPEPTAVASLILSAV